MFRNVFVEYIILTNVCYLNFQACSGDDYSSVYSVDVDCNLLASVVLCEDGAVRRRGWPRKDP
jgi:hypothetical protein